jgi:ABC-type transport system substrate-binding protein
VVSALNAGTVTATAELTEADHDLVNTGYFLEKNSSLGSGAFIFFNTKNALLKNPEFRAAIRQGIDIGKVREKAPDTVALNYPLLTSQIKLTNYPAIPEYNAEAAKAKIQELLGEEKLALNITTVNTGYLPAVANEISEELKSLGFETSVAVYEENQDFITNIISTRGYDLLVYDVELGADPDLLPYYHSSQTTGGGLNLSNYRNALVDDLLLGARDTLDEELRVKKYESFLEYWVADVPAIGLYQPNLTYYYNKNARAFGDDVKLVTSLDRFSDITDWAITKSTKNKTP